MFPFFNFGSRCCCCRCKPPKADNAAYGGKWLVYNGVPIDIAVPGGNYTVPLDQLLPSHNVGSGIDSLVIETGGDYDVTWALNVVPGVTARLAAAVAVNGSVQSQSEMINTAAQQFVEQKLGASTILRLAAGDVVTLVVTSDVAVELFPYTTSTASLLVKRLGEGGLAA
ncbi:MAG: hypothetical protein FWD16_05040 [Clostridia bacterium]|nr:hypothetical protein [Clostridia bacterium]